MVLSSTSEVASVAQVRWTGGGSADGQTSGTYEGFTVGTTEAFCPSVFQRLTAQYSVITVQNTDIGDATIDMYYFDRNGTAYSGNPLTDVIPANAQRTYDLTTPSSTVPSLPVVNPPGDGWIGGMKIAARDGKKIAAVAATHWPDYSSIYNCSGAGATTLYFPDIKRRVFSGVWAQFGGNVVQNLSSTTTASLTTYWMDRNGNQLYTFTDTIPPLASHGYNTRFTSSNVPDHAALYAALGDDRNGALLITSDQPLAGVYNGQTVSGSPAGATYAAGSSNNSGSTLYFPAVYRQVTGGSTWVKFSALLAFNPSTTDTASVTVRWYAQNGTQLFSFTDTIPPKSSHGYNTRFTGTNVPDTTALFAALGDSYRGGVSISSNLPILGTTNTVEPTDTDSYNAYAQ